jgi:hypothetical protein
MQRYKPEGGIFSSKANSVAGPLETKEDIEELLNQKADVQDLKDLLAIKTNK